MALALPLKRMRLLLVPIALFAASAGAQQERPVDWHQRDSYSGWVTDAYTGEPIEAVVVLGMWQIKQRWGLVGPKGRADERIIRLEEKLTDKEGRFEFTPLGDYSPPLGYEQDDVLSPWLSFFKPGYDPSSRQRFSWEYGEDEERQFDKATGRVLRKEGWQREIRLFRYGTRPDTSVVIDHSVKKSSPEQRSRERLKLYALSLSTNVETFATAAEQRKAVEAQWNVIVALDGEIRKFSPDYRWYSMEIYYALKERASNDETGRVRQADDVTP